MPSPILFPIASVAPFQTQSLAASRLRRVSATIGGRASTGRLRRQGRRLLQAIRWSAVRETSIGFDRGNTPNSPLSVPTMPPPAPNRLTSGVVGRVTVRTGCRQVGSGPEIPCNQDTIPGTVQWLEWMDAARTALKEGLPQEQQGLHIFPFAKEKRRDPGSGGGC
jgi:hypothetical protein